MWHRVLVCYTGEWKFKCSGNVDNDYLNTKMNAAWRSRINGTVGRVVQMFTAYCILGWYRFDAHSNWWFWRNPLESLFLNYRGLSIRVYWWKMVSHSWPSWFVGKCQMADYFNPLCFFWLFLFTTIWTCYSGAKTSWSLDIPITFMTVSAKSHLVH